MTPASPRPAFDLLDPAFYGRDPHSAYAWMRRNEPVYRDEKNELWAITTLDAVRAVEKDARTFSSQGHQRAHPHATARDMNAKDDPQHLAQRSLVADLFTPRAVTRFEAPLRALVVEVVERFFRGDVVDVVDALAARVPAVLTARLLGLPDAHWRDVKSWSERLIRLDRALADRRILEDGVAAVRDLGAVLEPILRERAAHPGDDVPSRWAAALGKGAPGARSLDFATVLDEASLFVSGGAETTRTAIAHALVLFCEHPEHWEELARHPERIPTAVEEILRYVTPLNNMFRRATKPAELDGVEIRSHDRLILLYASANRDERHFAEPDRFDPGRDPNPHIAFGFGTHFCVGAAFARLTLRVVFEELTARLTELRAARAPEIEPTIFVTAVKRFDLAYRRR